jgi:hypothetical protein
MSSGLRATFVLDPTGYVVERNDDNIHRPNTIPESDVHALAPSGWSECGGPYSSGTARATERAAAHSLSFSSSSVCCPQGVQPRRRSR